MFTPPDEPTFNVNQEEEGEGIPVTDIHTMPGKFLRPTGLPQKKGRLSWIIFGLLIFIVLAGVIITLFIFFSRQRPAEPKPAVLNVNQLQPPAVNQNQNMNTNVNQNLDNPSARDTQRLMDIMELRSALNLYFSQHQLYPASLDILLGEFLTVVPKNPQPFGEEYAYLVTSDQLDYQLTFVLEQGAALGNLKLAAGKYVASPLGIVAFNQEPVNQNTNTNLPTLPSPPAGPTRPATGLDSDNDGLTDIEENLYQTNSASSDSDSDGYQDQDELYHLYDPAKSGGARLLDSTVVKTYQNANYNYSVVYPSAWIKRSLTADNREVLFNSNTGEFVEIIIQPNPLSFSAYNWYINQNSNVEASRLTTLLIDGLPAIQTADGLTTYLGIGSNIYIITYNIGTNQQMNFYSTYQLFLKTFKLVSPQENPSGAATSTLPEGAGI